MVSRSTLRVPVPIVAASLLLSIAIGAATVFQPIGWYLLIGSLCLIIGTVVLFLQPHFAICALLILAVWDPVRIRVLNANLTAFDGVVLIAVMATVLRRVSGSRRGRMPPKAIILAVGLFLLASVISLFGAFPYLFESIRQLIHTIR